MGIIMEQKDLKQILLSMSEFHRGTEADAKEAIAAIYDSGMMIVDQQPHSTKLSWAIEVLRNHNLWRRGDDTKDPTNPTDLGNAIEIAIGVMDRANRGLMQGAVAVPDGDAMTRYMHHVNAATQIMNEEFDKDMVEIIRQAALQRPKMNITIVDGNTAPTPPESAIPTTARGCIK